MDTQKKTLEHGDYIDKYWFNGRVFGGTLYKSFALFIGFE